MILHECERLVSEELIILMGSLRFICFVCLVPVSKYVKLEENCENICIERTPCHINLINIKPYFVFLPLNYRHRFSAQPYEVDEDIETELFFDSRPKWKDTLRDFTTENC